MTINISEWPLNNIVILVTEQCNLRCSYCYIKKQPKAMSEETAKQTVAFLFENAPKDNSPVSITFFGGEPLLEPELIERIHTQAVEIARRQKRAVGFNMTTNATLITQKNFDLISRLNINVRISLDGIEDSHDLHRKTISGKGSFKLIQKQMERTKKLKNVSVRLTASPETVATLPQSIEWLNDHGFKSISFSEVVEAQWDEQSLTELFKARKKLHEINAKQNDIRLRQLDSIGNVLKLCGSRWGCGAARNFVAVDTSGYLYPCHRFIGYFRNGEEQRIGHIDTGFDKANRGKYLQANHSTGRSGCGQGLFSKPTKTAKTNCDSCKLLQVCGSNCMAINEYMTGDPGKPHPINRVLAQIKVSNHVNAQQPNKQLVNMES